MIEGTPKPVDVLLICMPFHAIHCPSIGLSLLKASLASCGMSTQIQYFTLALAKQIGMDTYLQIVEKAWHTQIGEWIFGEALFQRSNPDVEAYIESVVRSQSIPDTPFLDSLPETLVESVLQIRHIIGCYLDECLSKVIKRSPYVVGFSSLYQQQTSSLALARRIKENLPEVFIVFGGPNCEGEMGIEMIRQFPFIDAVVSGEGETVFPQLVQRFLSGKPVSGLIGVYTQSLTLPDTLCTKYPNAPSVHDLDALPYPDYDDYFEQLEAEGIFQPYDTTLLMETSRGCWWAQDGRCTFCSFNSTNNVYRTKSDTRALKELEDITQRYPCSRIRLADNVLKVDDSKGFIAGLAALRLGIPIFCDIRPDVNKQQICSLHDAGITVVQPGIENLSTPILRLIHKGTTGIQNIQLLKWCEELGISCYWNFLWGFPGEPAEEYTRMANLVQLLMHLEPPKYVGPFRVDRFSSYFENPDQYGLTEVKPWPSYRYIYDLPVESLDNLAYYFSYSYRFPQNVKIYTRRLVEAVAIWKEAYAKSELFSVDKGNTLLIWDGRPFASEKLTVLSGLKRVLYTACDSIQSISRLKKIANKHGKQEFTKEQIQDLLQHLLDRGLMIREGSRYLNLAIPMGKYVPSRKGFERFLRYLNFVEGLSLQKALIQKVRIGELPDGVTISGAEMKNFLP